MASLAKRADGHWRARHHDAAGKEHSHHFKRKVDAQRWLNEVTTAVTTGMYVDPRAVADHGRRLGAPLDRDQGQSQALDARPLEGPVARQRAAALEEREARRRHARGCCGLDLMRRRAAIVEAVAEVGGKAVFSSPKSHQVAACRSHGSLRRSGELVAGKAPEDFIFTSRKGGLLRLTINA